MCIAICIVQKAGTIRERTTSNAGDTIRNGDTGKSGTIRECATSNAGDTIWDDDVDKAGTIRECAIINAYDFISINFPWNIYV